MEALMIGRRTVLRLCAVLVVLAPLVLPARGAEPTASHVCGDCHKDIYRMWLSSSHATSLENPVFMDVLRETQKREGDEVRKVCLHCHAPLVQFNQDYDLSRRITWEGTNCDYCHSIVEVDESGHRPEARVEIGDIKRGPIRNASSTGHEVAYSELHGTALACAPCHQWANSEGTAIMTTYSEWQESRAAADGQSCQSCHMGLTRADVVDPKVKRVAHAEVNLHEVPGGHSLELLHRALAVSISNHREAGNLALKVRLTNKGAGHAVPTGMPGRRVILEVGVETSGGRSFAERRSYEKTFANKAGKTIKQDLEFFTGGVRFLADTRIQPDEKRTEEFRFPLPAEATAYVTVKLHYEHAPRGTEEDRTWLTFLSEKRVVRPAPKTGG
jgi:hypothetical protein